MSPKTRKRLSVLVACALLAGPAAWAVDGVLEINQACVANGCFPGDDPGFPVEITQPGSYRLTGNLQVPDENTTAIEVNDAVKNVTIDLNGFTISGSTVCEGLPFTCSPLGPGDGIRGNELIRVTNGTVRSMGHSGVVLGRKAQVEGVRAEQNGSEGIEVGDVSRVVDCTALSNGSNGIKVGVNALVKGCIAGGNVGHGIRGGSAMAIHNITTGNRGSGISVSGGNVLGNRAEGNQDYGLEVFAGQASYADNNFSFNNGGNTNPQVLNGLEIGTNLCGTDTNCP